MCDSKQWLKKGQIEEDLNIIEVMYDINFFQTRRIHCEEKNTLVPRDKAIKKLNIKNITDPYATTELLNALLLPSM